MKYYGNIGYASLEETSPGVYTPNIVERPHYGDVLRNYRTMVTAQNQVNDNLDINNELSIVADPFALTNFHSIRYACFMDTKWKVTGVEVQYPRLILRLGGVYNGDEA